MADKSYRNIRPSFGESSRSGQNLQEENEEGGRSSPEPRRKMSTGPKHRKVPESVTRNACLNCKKARAKVSAPFFLEKYRESLKASSFCIITM